MRRRSRRSKPNPAAISSASPATSGRPGAIEDLVRRHPEVDILVNNLGIFEPKPFEDIPDADWMRFFEVNVLSGVRLSRAYLPAMKRANWGRIIFISSESALQIPAEMIHYGVTKTAQIAVARGLAETVAGTGITVNSVLPGPTRSRGVDDFVDALSSGGAELRGVRDGVLREGPSDLAHQALRLARGGRLARRLSREPARRPGPRARRCGSTAAWSRAPFEGASAVGLKPGEAPARSRVLDRAEMPIDTAELARFLIGKMLVRMLAEGVAGGRIVETEAYSIGDAAGHAYRGMTRRNRALFLERGHAYVYLAYGVSFMLNVSSETAGVGAGVLIRAIEPTIGVDILQRNRGAQRLQDLARGPGRLCEALGIDRRLDGIDLCQAGALWLGSDGSAPGEIGLSKRIGITRAADSPLRFYVRGSRFVSGPQALNR